MKSKTLLSFLLTLFAFNGYTQEFELLSLNSPGEKINYETSDFIEDEEIKNFKESSVGILYMPIPLNIKSITFTTDGQTEKFDGSVDLFNMGIGIALNQDWEKSGMGFGSIMYFAYIWGDKDIAAFDVFAALKYDLPLGNRLTTNFELSPLLGLGMLNFSNTDSSESYGSSFYFSGGTRITWRISNTVFAGGDFQTTPMLFDTRNLLGVKDQVDEAKIEYKFFAQVNFSLRFNLD